MLPNPDIKDVKLQDYLAILRKRALVIIAFLIIIPSTVAIRVYNTPSVYRATASLLIERSMPKITKFEDVYQVGQRDTQYYQTQYSILGSRAMAERVFDDLRLRNDPDYGNTDNPAARLQGQIHIDPLKNSQIVYVSVEDTDALRASAIANTLVKIYIQQDIDQRNRGAKEAVGWLETQLTDVKKKMQKSEEALNRYIQENRMVTIPDIEKKTESLLGSLKSQESKFETELAELLKRYKEKHPRIIALNAELDDVTKKIEQETTNLLELNQKSVQYNLLKKDSESNQQLYTSILQRAKETDVSEKLQTATIRVVDSAKPPRSPIRPKRSQEIMRSIFISLMCGVGLALFLEYLDSSIRTAEDVRIYVNLPFLGYIANANKETKVDAEKNLICHQKQKSQITEAYRSIRTSILFASPEDKPLKSILITSPLPQEGKTFISSNLATIFSQLNERVVLLDIDMRRPKIHKTFNISQKGGLSDYLTGNIAIEDILKSTMIPNLTLISSGTVPPNPSELLSSVKVRTLFDNLKGRFDRVILDSPPILSVADASLLANIVDGVILVIKGASTRLDAIIQAKSRILEAKGKIIGVIVNDIEPEKEDRYYYYHYYYSSDEVKDKKK